MKDEIMKYKILLLFMIFLFLVPNSQTFSQESQMNDLKSQVEKIRQKFVPDKRTAIFEFEILKDDTLFKIKGKTNLPQVFEAIKRMAKSFKVAFEDFVLLPDKNLGNKIYALANLSVINIRSKPQHSAELATQALLGTPLKVFEARNDWYRVQTPDGYIAWTDADAIELKTKKGIKKWAEAKKIVYMAECGYSFENPHVNAPHVSDLVAGDILELVDEVGEFYCVKYPDGRTAYVSKSEAQKWGDWLNSRTLSAGDIISTAFRFMGTPYLWGGTSPKMLDCSGFTKTVYFLNGILLQRDASQQVLTGEPVDISQGLDNLQPGDLLFFGKRATDSTKERITHVAIYLGNGEFIHASGRVKLNSLDSQSPIFSEYRYKTFLHARRILSSIGKNGVEKISRNLFYRGEF
jgi:SH3-like domain-containing protein